MSELRVAHTADLDEIELGAVRALLDAVFGDEMTAHDWDHALGGIHAVVSDRGEVIAHASVVQRRLLHQGRALRAGYVEGVAVRLERRGEGHGAAVMEVIERVVRGAYELGALGATEAGAGFYAARGWEVWPGPTSALTPTGIARTREEDGSIFVLPVSASLDRHGGLICDWREGDVW